MSLPLGGCASAGRQIGKVAAQAAVGLAVAGVAAAANEALRPPRSDKDRAEAAEREQRLLDEQDRRLIQEQLEADRNLRARQRLLRDRPLQYPML